MKILFKSFVDYFRDDGPMLAGAISCFFMLAFIPFFIFIVSIFGYVLGHNSDFYHFFMSRVVGLFPQVTHQITRELRSIVLYREIGIVTLLIYGLFSYQLYVSLETAVHQIFKVKIKRSLIFSVLLALLTVTLLVTFTILSFGAMGILSLLEELRIYFPGLKIGVAAAFLSRFVLSPFLVFVFTTALYLLLPRKKVRFPHALWGGVFTAVFLEAAKHVFTFYMAVKISQLGTVYGSLTAIITFLMWLFYSSSIFLIGAELVRHLGNTKGK
ncbi:MAG: YihY/virulence factor BrkB family protein [Deltaproteobacteria bacterium]|nr:YihY/virulence factor BrkB family protein [Deltaproteobacteria bacterium]